MVLNIRSTTDLHICGSTMVRNSRQPLLGTFMHKSKFWKLIQKTMAQKMQGELVKFQRVKQSLLAILYLGWPFLLLRRKTAQIVPKMETRTK